MRVNSSSSFRWVALSLPSCVLVILSYLCCPSEHFSNPHAPTPVSGILVKPGPLTWGATCSSIVHYCFLWISYSLSRPILSKRFSHLIRSLFETTVEIICFIHFGSPVSRTASPPQELPEGWGGRIENVSSISQPSISSTVYCRLSVTAMGS